MIYEVWQELAIECIEVELLHEKGHVTETETIRPAVKLLKQGYNPDNKEDDYYIEQEAFLLVEQERGRRGLIIDLWFNSFGELSYGRAGEILFQMFGLERLRKYYRRFSKINYIDTDVQEIFNEVITLNVSFQKRKQVVSAASPLVTKTIEAQLTVVNSSTPEFTFQESPGNPTDDAKKIDIDELATRLKSSLGHSVASTTTLASSAIDVKVHDSQAKLFADKIHEIFEKDDNIVSIKIIGANFPEDYLLHYIYTEESGHPEALLSLSFILGEQYELFKNLLEQGFSLKQGDKIKFTKGQTREERTTLLMENIRQKTASSAVEKNVGGIDFRALPMTIQPMGSFVGLNFKLPQLSQAELAKMNIDSEMQQIQQMIASGILPSGQRVKELIAACNQKKEMGARADNLLLCLIDICKLEEENAYETEPELREALVIVDALS
jgi:hypothetical protein